MSRTLTPRETKLTAIAKAIRDAGRDIETEWPKSKLDDPMLHGDRHHYFKGKVMDAELVKQGAAIIESMLVAADGIHMLMTLAGKNKPAFDAIVILAQIELDRKPSEVAA